MTDAPLLELRNVSRIFGGGGMLSQRQVVALQDFSLIIDDREPSIVAVVGESGSGKTTMARLLLGLERPTSGRVLYRGTELDKLKNDQWREYRRGLRSCVQRLHTADPEADAGAAGE